MRPVLNRRAMNAANQTARSSLRGLGRQNRSKAGGKPNGADTDQTYTYDIASSDANGIAAPILSYPLDRDTSSMISMRRVGPHVFPKNNPLVGGSFSSG